MTALRVALVALVAAVAVLAGDAALLVTRIDRVTVDLHPGTGTTWVLLGLDSRAALPEGAAASEFGTTEQVPGSRADVVLVVHDGGVLSIPRDLLVRGAGGPGRLALTWLDGPQSTVDALCDLGVPTDHLVTVDLAGFAAVVDAAGGLDLDVPRPVRDPAAGLLIAEAGRQHVDGRTALALVRSRHPEHLVDGAWQPAPVDPDGRATAAGTVLTALVGAVREAGVRPWLLQRVAWAASGSLTVDAATSATDLASLAGADLGDIEVLPAGEPNPQVPVRIATDGTAAALAAAGLSCSR
ncbi:LCP family protein [Geodermatophilus sp. CPCC 205761]|uniref:LCP family protein n=1 Tax=Geodermatophilus sp. CPCC 205761 TaxID=2936597 RepID=UPI003EEE420A